MADQALRARPRRSRAAVLVLAAALAVAGCTRGAEKDGASSSTTTLGPDGGAALANEPALAAPSPGTHRRGGTARVGLWGEPDPAAATLAGAAVRSLVLPQLFVARPDGRWETSMVEPGTDRLSPDGTMATFRLRSGASWSDGAPITAEDLRRDADEEFVAGVETGPDGAISVHLKQRLPGWRRLWSGVDSIEAPRAGVWGGPFVVASVTPGLETLLRPNPKWNGGGAFLDELHLVAVPDSEIQRRLLARGELDAIQPWAGTARTSQLEAVDGVQIAGTERGGWWVGLLLNAKLDGPRRRAVIETVDRRRFVATLLRGEATVLDGLSGPEDATWAQVAAGASKGLGKVVLTGAGEEPMTGLLERAMQKRARAAGGELELRNADANEVEHWLATGEYEAAIAPLYDGLAPCWTCRWKSVDEVLALKADAGDRQAIAELEAKLRDEARVLPLWRGRTVVAWRTGLKGVEANGYALSAAWNAWRWHR